MTCYHFFVRALLVAVVAVAGCGPSGTADLRLGWRFADDRLCADAGAATIVLASGGVPIGDPNGYVCADGEQGKNVLVPAIPRATPRITVEARTYSSDPVYRGDLALADPFPDPATVTLYFTGGK